MKKPFYGNKKDFEVDMMHQYSTNALYADNDKIGAQVAEIAFKVSILVLDNILVSCDLRLLLITYHFLGSNF